MSEVAERLLKLVLGCMVVLLFTSSSSSSSSGTRSRIPSHEIEMVPNPNPNPESSETHPPLHPQSSQLSELPQSDAPSDPPQQNPNPSNGEEKGWKLYLGFTTILLALIGIAGTLLEYTGPQFEKESSPGLWMWSKLSNTIANCYLVFVLVYMVIYGIKWYCTIPKPNLREVGGVFLTFIVCIVLGSVLKFSNVLIQNIQDNARV